VSTTAFHVPVNGASSKVAVARSLGGPTVTVQSGTSFGSSFPLIATVSRANSVLAIYEVTGRSGNVLSLGATREGTSDVALQVGDLIECRPTAGAMSEIHTAVNALESSSIAGPYASVAQSAFPGFNIAGWGDSLMQGFTSPFPTQLAGLIPRSVFNGGISGETSTQIRSRMLAATTRFNDSVIIWAGRNDPANGISSTTTKANIAAMVAALGHTRYLILSIPNSSAEPSGSSAYNAIVTLNSDLATIYGVHYFDVRSYLVSQYNPSLSQDAIDHAADIPPTSLRFDTLHPNDAGDALIAAQVVARIAILDGADVPLKPASLGGVMLSLDTKAGLADANTFTATQSVVAATSDARIYLQSPGQPQLQVVGAGTLGPVQVKFQSFGDDGFGATGTTTNHPYSIYTNNQITATFEVNGDIHLANGKIYGAYGSTNGILCRFTGDGNMYLDSDVGIVLRTGIADSLVNAVTFAADGSATFASPPHLPHLTDSAAPNDSWYYSTTTSKASYKDPSGVSHPLY
jgi:lysophospholipase L1-like esterase